MDTDREHFWTFRLAPTETENGPSVDGQQARFAIVNCSLICRWPPKSEFRRPPSETDQRSQFVFSIDIDGVFDWWRWRTQIVNFNRMNNGLNTSSTEYDGEIFDKDYYGGKNYPFEDYQEVCMIMQISDSQHKHASPTGKEETRSLGTILT
ncbi:unnamed protein product [Anisakis simplex]|uniref:MATH domain-containing protein n=1 Tax=Anisakis simplex TaxID=6269 RepID=A0A0M3JHV8_ANISI|nr:unnamed protein product [Anisakis simplex]